MLSLLPLPLPLLPSPEADVLSDADPPLEEEEQEEKTHQLSCMLSVIKTDAMPPPTDCDVQFVKFDSETLHVDRYQLHIAPPDPDAAHDEKRQFLMISDSALPLFPENKSAPPLPPVIVQDRKMQLMKLYEKDVSKTCLECTSCDEIV